MSDRRPGAGLQPRSIRYSNIGAHNPDRYEGRISRTDEATLATRTRRKNIVRETERIEREIWALNAVMKADPDLCSKQTQRDYGNAATVLGKGRSKLSQLPQ